MAGGTEDAWSLGSGSALVLGRTRDFGLVEFTLGDVLDLDQPKISRGVAILGPARHVGPAKRSRRVALLAIALAVAATKH
jgi:hypothetical protein